MTLTPHITEKDITWRFDTPQQHVFSMRAMLWQWCTWCFLTLQPRWSLRSGLPMTHPRPSSRGTGIPDGINGGLFLLFFLKDSRVHSSTSFTFSSSPPQWLVGAGAAAAAAAAQGRLGRAPPGGAHIRGASFRTPAALLVQMVEYKLNTYGTRAK